MKIHEVGLRDGLQNESKLVPIELKLKIIDDLVNAGIELIQVGSFVNQKLVPQMANTDEVFKHIKSKYENIQFSALVLNEKGLERALDCDVDMICLGVSASETHSKKNTGMSTKEATQRIIKIAEDATKAGKKVQVSVQSAFGCGFEGKISEVEVFRIINAYLNAGLKNISLSDTAGHAYPEQVKKMFREVKNLGDDITLTCHFHNTYGLGIANLYAASISGVEFYETSIGGLGGCPFTKVASGNVCTEDLIHAIQRNGSHNKIDLNQLIEISKYLSSFFEKELPGYVYKVGKIDY